MSSLSARPAGRTCFVGRYDRYTSRSRRGIEKGRWRTRPQRIDAWQRASSPYVAMSPCRGSPGRRRWALYAIHVAHVRDAPLTPSFPPRSPEVVEVRRTSGTAACHSTLVTLRCTRYGSYERLRYFSKQKNHRASVTPLAGDKPAQAVNFTSDLIRPQPAIALLYSDSVVRQNGPRFKSRPQHRGRTSSSQTAPRAAPSRNTQTIDSKGASAWLLALRRDMAVPGLSRLQAVHVRLSSM